MRLILLGPPGSGKGTQAAKLSKKLKVPHISTGEIFRRMAEDGSALGLEAKKYWEKGYYVPDALTNKLVEERLLEKDCRKGFILDGYPRTAEQAKEFSAIARRIGFKVDAVINLAVKYESVVHRLGSRSRCKKCGTIYGGIHKLKKSGRCDKDRAELEQRVDDQPAQIKERLRIYQRQTVPLLSFYNHLRVDVDGEKSPDEVFKALLLQLKKK